MMVLDIMTCLNALQMHLIPDRISVLAQVDSSCQLIAVADVWTMELTTMYLAEFRASRW